MCWRRQTIQQETSCRIDKRRMPKHPPSAFASHGAIFYQVSGYQVLLGGFEVGRFFERRSL